MAISERTHYVAQTGYRRRERPTDPQSLAKWVEDQLDDIERLSTFVEDVPQAADTPPQSPRIGLRRYAVAPWDPGQGSDRWYTYNGTSWVPDENGSAISTGDVVAIAEGLDVISADSAALSAGNPASTTTFVSLPPSPSFNPNAFVVSLEDDNIIFVNDTYVGGFNRGESYEFQATQGDKITSARGHSGLYAIEGNAERLVELSSAANAGRQFLWFAFRNAPHRHVVQSLSIATRVRVYGPNPTVNTDGSSPEAPIQDVELPAFGFLDFSTPTDGEYYILADQPVVVTTTNNALGFDQRTLAPLTTRLFGYGAGAAAGDARISALYANTQITVRTQDGLFFQATVDPGSPLSLHGLDGSPINLTRYPHYAPQGALIVTATGPIAGFSGADGAGTNASTFQPLASASQVIGLPLGFLNTGDAKTGIACISEYAGTVRVVSPTGSVLMTRSLERSGILFNPVALSAHQKYPAAARFSSDESDFTADIPRGSYLVSDVPISVVANFNEGNGSIAQEDETACFGITPSALKAEIREDTSGYLRRRSIDGAGNETWVLV